MQLKDCTTVEELENLVKEGEPNLSTIYLGKQQLTDGFLKTLWYKPISTDLFLNNAEGKSIASVTVTEAYNCCGKFYLHGFSPTDKVIHFTALLKGAEFLAKRLGYTYIGFIHKTDNPVIKAAEDLEWQCLLQFKNQRSQNTLNEMYKFLR